MRIIFLFVFYATILSIVPAHARLGETEDQCIARYGPVVKRDTSNTTGKPLPILFFSKNGYIIGAILLDGKVGFLQISKLNNSELSDDEIKTLLDANSDNQKWANQGVTSGRTVWYRDDGSQAQYDPMDHGLYLIAKAYIDATAEGKKATEDKNLNGF